MPPPRPLLLNVFFGKSEHPLIYYWIRHEYVFDHAQRDIWMTTETKKKYSHQSMTGPLSRRLCSSISRNNEKKMTPTATMSIFFKCLRVDILFLMDSVNQIIRSSEIHIEQPYQIWMQSISYRAHRLFRWPSWKMAAYGLVPKKYMGWIAQGHRSCL